MFAASFVAYYGSQNKKDAKLEKISLKDPAEKLSKLFGNFLISKHFVSVPQVEELKTLRNYLLQQELLNKTVIFGPRGIGKIPAEIVSCTIINRSEPLEDIVLGQCHCVILITIKPYRRKSFEITSI